MGPLGDGKGPRWSGLHNLIPVYLPLICGSVVFNFRMLGELLTHFQELQNSETSTDPITTSGPVWTNKHTYEHFAQMEILLKPLVFIKRKVLETMSFC